MGDQIGDFYKSIYSGKEMENAFSTFHNMAEPYSTSKPYVVGDVCLYNNNLYQCTSPTTGTWNAAKWQQVYLDEIGSAAGTAAGTAAAQAVLAQKVDIDANSTIGFAIGIDANGPYIRYELS